MNHAAPTTRSDKLFATAFNLAMAGDHRDSDEILELAHEMRAQEQKLASIAEHAPEGLAVLMVKAAMTGFTDDVPLADYVAANRESILLYSKHDSEIKALLQAVFHPKAYQRVELHLTDEELASARSELSRRHETNKGERIISDPIITPYAIALQARGFREFLNGGKCSILRECASCRNKYETKVHFQQRAYWACPHCNTIKEA